MSIFTIGVGVNNFVIKDNKVLLGKRAGNRSGSGLWNLPGGHLEFGEHLIEGASRELFEETGLIAKESHFVQLINSPDQDQFHYIQINFLVTKWEGEPTLKEPDKCSEWKWFDLDNLPEDIFYAHKQFFHALKEGKNFVN